MDKIYELAGNKIKVVLEPQLIRVYGNAQLWAYLKGKADRRSERSELLVNTIKADYEHHFGQALAISNASLIVEILVHIYCDYLGLSFNRIVPIKWIRNVVKKLLKRAEVVDCGEKSVDSNRWVWDLLAGSKALFIRILPENLNARNIKQH
ncbi:hypothetical protein [Pedobacter zeae]|uniref:Uncharacterized protein n=1 Tax=Pedobacter zeae TaxID=1737356 RepID=A0A7W6P5F6_9SPHI|nr:hypothetical protein [Pedobacter zeae]MBB4106824.1 hypothetical protein [Pedobacter zeae]GGH03971.1 hypothetical protein GCM10007422_19340 [Pedobacter zeae]